MAPTLTMFMGLPGSGKTTAAKARVKEKPNSIKRVNKDDLRAMMDAGHWSKGNEKFVLQVRDYIIREALLAGKHVISDDTNLHPKHKQQLRQIAKECDANFQINDEFLQVSVEECIKRDLMRNNSVGEKVILDMYNNFLKPTEQTPVYQPPVDAPEAVLVDIDGTLAHILSPDCSVHNDHNATSHQQRKCTCRSPYAWDRVREDVVDKSVADLVRLLHDNGYQIILLSGRDGFCLDDTILWLAENSIPYHNIIMRAEGDTRKDSIVKKELFEQHIEKNFAVKFVIDDRNQVVDMWHDIGLKVLHVGDYRKSNF